jgi:hypothetical protein
MSRNIEDLSLEPMLRIHMPKPKVLLTKIVSYVNKLAIHIGYLILIEKFNCKFGNFIG